MERWRCRPIEAKSDGALGDLLAADVSGCVGLSNRMSRSAWPPREELSISWTAASPRPRHMPSLPRSALPGGASAIAHVASSMTHPRHGNGREISGVNRLTPHRSAPATCNNAPGTGFECSVTMPTCQSQSFHGGRLCCGLLTTGKKGFCLYDQPKSPRPHKLHGCARGDRTVEPLEGFLVLPSEHACMAK
jgi:hypothetical protein